MDNDNPKISIIMPSYNEEKHISKAIESLLFGAYPIEKLEIFVIDGKSSDATQNEVQKLIEKDLPITLLINENRTVPYALNMAIPLCNGDYICRVDAHCVYPSNYLTTFVSYARKFPEADNIGCACILKPSNPSNTAKASAIASTHPFGSGNAAYKKVFSEPRFVDTVPFGFFKRETFKKYGLFDTDLIRNQDDEFNYRILKNGGKVLLIPETSIDYFARENFSKLFKMDWQYGYFKPLCLKKIRKLFNIRQFVPPITVTVIFLCLLGLIFGNSHIKVLSSLPILLYIFTLVLISAERALKKGIVLFPYLIVAFIVIHFGYGLGFLRGILDHLILNKKYTDISISR